MKQTQQFFITSAEEYRLATIYLKNRNIWWANELPNYVPTENYPYRLNIVEDKKAFLLWCDGPEDNPKDCCEKRCTLFTSCRCNQKPPTFTVFLRKKKLERLK